MKNLLNILFMGIILLLGCSRERPVEFLQGSDANKVKIELWDERSFPVTTKEVLKDVQASHAEKTDFKQYPHVNDMNLVHFESSAALLQKDIPFRGLPNTEDIYRVCYEVTDTHLIVHKVARPEFLPSQELTYKRLMSPVSKLEKWPSPLLDLRCLSIGRNTSSMRMGSKLPV